MISFQAAKEQLDQNEGQFSLSSRVASIPQALSIYINQIVYDLRRMNKDVIALSLGEAFFDIPIFNFNCLNIDKGYHYSDTQGLPELRLKISNYYEKYYNASVDPSEIMISAGSKVVIFMCIQAVAESGDEILIHEPAWLSYQEHAHLVGAEVKFIPYNCTVDKFSDYMSPKTKMLIINNPNNPSGRLYSKEDLESIYLQARENNCYVLVDEAYSDFVINEPFVSMAELVPDKTGVFIVNSLSKNMGMSGWRIGYLITHPKMLDQILKINQHTVTCAPTILQQYVATYFDNIIELTLPQVRKVVEKRERCDKMMKELNIEHMGGDSTFYFFVNIGKFPGSSMDFALHLLLEKNVAVVPGSAYGRSTERFVRVSIGTESEERIWHALQMIRDLIHVKEFDSRQARVRMSELGIAELN